MEHTKLIAPKEVQDKFISISVFEVLMLAGILSAEQNC